MLLLSQNETGALVARAHHLNNQAVGSVIIQGPEVSLNLGEQAISEALHPAVRHFNGITDCLLEVVLYRTGASLRVSSWLKGTGWRCV